MTTYISFATCEHLYKGTKLYFRQYFGFEEKNQNDATEYESIEDCEAAIKNYSDTLISEEWHGRVIIEDTTDGEEITFSNNI